MTTQLLLFTVRCQNPARAPGPSDKLLCGRPIARLHLPCLGGVVQVPCPHCRSVSSFRSTADGIEATFLGGDAKVRRGFDG
jgi:hypothetical protein